MRISIFEKVEVFYPQCIKGRLFVKKNREEGGQTKPKYLRKCNTIDFSVTTKERTKKTCLWFVLSIWSSEVSEKNPSFSIIKGWLWDYFPCLVDFVQWSFWHFLFFLKNDSEWRKILWLILFYQKKDIHLNENFTRGWILPWRRFVILTESSIIHMVFQSKLMQLSDSRGIKKNSPTYSIPTDNSPFKKSVLNFFVEKKFFQINNF